MDCQFWLPRLSREKVAFTVPHYITGARYMVRADSKIDDLPQFDEHAT